MPKGILYVESRPVSPDREDEYNRWYDETHLREVVALPGFVAARRYHPADGDGAYVAIYDVDVDDLSAVMATLGEAATSGKLQMSDAMQMDPPPSVQILGLTAEYAPRSTTV
jgi:antibiotic biosynthesis monooxygenase (ABM) superfamily enzyme